MPADENTPDAVHQPERLIPYPQAAELLRIKLNATPEEIAAWIWIDMPDPNTSGLQAFRNGNEPGATERFRFPGQMGADYLAALMACWFREVDVQTFSPTHRFITGSQLIDRWSGNPNLHPEGFIDAKIREARLTCTHPTLDVTIDDCEDEHYVPLRNRLFLLEDVERIEVSELRLKPPCIPTLDSAEQQDADAAARSRLATKGADARHNAPGGSREKQRKIRELWQSGRYRSRDECAAQEHQNLGMSYDAARKALTKVPRGT
jgi:hypothetical protein